MQLVNYCAVCQRRMRVPRQLTCLACKATYDASDLWVAQLVRDEKRRRDRERRRLQRGLVEIVSLSRVSEGELQHATRIG